MCAGDSSVCTWNSVPKAQALRLAAEILDEDDRRLALVAAPRKFLEAAKIRHGANGSATPRRKYKRREQKAKPKTKSPIHGPRMSLFLLEHLSEDDPKPRAYLLEQLAAAGSPLASGRSLNGPLSAALVRRGLVKETRDGLRRTSRGTKHRDTLRTALEAAGSVSPGGYMIPATQ